MEKDNRHQCQEDADVEVISQIPRSIYYISVLISNHQYSYMNGNIEF